jgi:hypothetical protein
MLADFSSQEFKFEDYANKNQSFAILWQMIDFYLLPARSLSNFELK